MNVNPEIDRYERVIATKQPKRTASLLAASLASMVLVGFAFAQSIVTSGGRRWSPFRTYDGKSKPPLSLPEAYVLAQGRIGEATNRFYCGKASSLEMTNKGFTGWTFWFSNTNAEQARIDVFFDKEVYRNPKRRPFAREASFGYCF